MAYEDLSDDTESISIDRIEYEIEAVENGDYIEVKFQSVLNARSYGYGLTNDNVTKISSSELSNSFSDGYYTVKISKDIFSSGSASTASRSVSSARSSNGRFSIVLFASTSSNPTNNWIVLKSVDVALSLTVAPNITVANRNEDSIILDARSEAVSGGMTYSVSYGNSRNLVQFESKDLPYEIKDVGKEAFDITVSHKYTGTSSYCDQTQQLSVPLYDERQADIDITTNDDGSVTLKGIPEKAINMPNFAIVTTGSDNEFTIIAEESSSNLSGTATISGEMFGTGFYAGNVRFVFYGNSPNDSDAIVSPAFDYVSDLNQLKTEEKIGRQSYSVSIPVSEKLGLSDSDITVSGISDATVSKKLEGNNLVISIGAGELISRTAYKLNVSFNVPSYGRVIKPIDFTTGSFAGKYEWNYDSSHQFAVIVEDSPAGSDVNYYVYTSPDDNKYNGQKLRLNPLYIKDSDLPDGGVSYSDAPEAYKWNNSKWNTSGIDPSRLSDIRTTIISRDYVSAEVDSQASGFSVTTTTSVEFKETENTCYMIFYNYITGGDSLGVSFGRPALVSNPNPDSSKFETSSYHFALSYQGS